MVGTVRKQEGEKERVQDLFLRSLEFRCRNSSGQKLKFIASTRAMRVYQKRGISPKIQRRRFGEIKVFRLRRCS